MAPTEGGRYEFTLYVAGTSGLSARAIVDARQLFELHLGGGYRLSVVDLIEDSGAAGRVVAASMLVRTQPLPERRIVGDLSDTDKVLLALDLERSGRA